MAEKINWFQILEAGLRALEKDQEDEAYLKELANKYVLKDPKNYSSVRSIVLDVHFKLEYHLDTAIKWYLCFYNRRKHIFSEGDYSKIGDVISNIDYAKKLKIVELLSIFSKQTIGIFWKTNDLRIAFAHNYKKDSPKYLFCGESIFNRKVIEKLISGLELAIAEFSEFIIEEGDASV